ncbi:MAG TPA: type II CAAX endopeptidase family protein [Pyrinomonadaceae bacterium]|nr:type II CAAX endopeptidase family protein [Pyrinomonadaceae bacterium]
MGTGRLNHSRWRGVAATRHTLGLLLALLAVSIWGAYSSPLTEWPKTLSQPRARVVLYAQILVLQWLWAGYVWIGIRRSGTSLRAFVDDSTLTGLRWLRHLGIGIAAWVAWMVIGSGLATVLRPDAEQLRSLQAMFPKTPLERGLWVGFALTAGLCEELVYRGYLLKQFKAVTGSTLAAVVLQALVYGLAHLVLPAQMVVSVGLLGVLLGVLAVWQRSLVPGMILHVGVGLAALAVPG